ncbi:hypothetical protein [Streptomyces angustmyceticus]|uniref:hypothetical protein n=1 Tax=Streptomyces angustmyceticus TaxID=285578 RepID=UPI00381F33FE
MRAGALFAHLTWARLTSATDCSSSPGLPIPTARDWRGGGQRGQLPTAVGSLLPTPSTSENTGPGYAAQGGMNLRHVVSLLPTPRATDGTKGAVSRTNATDRRVQSGRANLPEAALSAFPKESSSGASTPTRSRAGGKSSSGPPQGQLTLWDG